MGPLTRSEVPSLEATRGPRRRDTMPTCSPEGPLGRRTAEEQQPLDIAEPLPPPAPLQSLHAPGPAPLFSLLLEFAFPPNL